MGHQRGDDENAMRLLEIIRGDTGGGGIRKTNLWTCDEQTVDDGAISMPMDLDGYLMSPGEVNASKPYISSLV